MKRPSIDRTPLAAAALCAAMALWAAAGWAADESEWRPVGETVETVSTTQINPPNPGTDASVVTTTYVRELEPRSVTAGKPVPAAAETSADTRPSRRLVKRQTFAGDQSPRSAAPGLQVPEPQWVPRLAEEVVTVRKPVVERADKIERRTVRKPVVERSEREEAYAVLRPVYETSEREERVTVCRPVYQQQEIDQTVTAYEPAVAYQTYYAGFGQWVTTPVTTYVPVQTVEKVPTQTVQYVESQEVRKVPVRTVRYVEERETRKIPVETTRWVEEQIIRRTPVERVRYVEQRVVRKVPVSP